MGARLNVHTCRTGSILQTQQTQWNFSVPDLTSFKVVLPKVIVLVIIRKTDEWGERFEASNYGSERFRVLPVTGYKTNIIINNVRHVASGTWYLVYRVQFIVHEFAFYKVTSHAKPIFDRLSVSNTNSYGWIWLFSNTLKSARGHPPRFNTKSTIEFFTVKTQYAKTELSWYLLVSLRLLDPFIVVYSLLILTKLAKYKIMCVNTVCLRFSSQFSQSCQLSYFLEFRGNNVFRIKYLEFFMY